MVFPSLGVSSRLQRLSPRERVLVGAACLVALVFAPLKALDWSQVEFQKLVEARASLSAAQAQGDPTQLRRVIKQVNDGMARLKAGAWDAPSFPVARVLVEQDVAVAAVKAGIVQPQVAASEQPEMIGPARFARVEVSGPFTWPTFAALLQRVSARGRRVIVDRAAVQDEAGAQQFRLTLLAPVNISAAQ